MSATQEGRDPIKEIILSSFKLSGTEQEFSYDDKICHEFYANVKDALKDGIRSLSEEEIRCFINLAAKKTLGPDGTNMEYSRALRSVSMFDWDSIAILPSPTISELTTKLYNDTEVKSEFYSLKQEDGLYLNMVKVTNANKDFWKDFHENGAIGGDRHIDAGTSTFYDSISFYDHKNNEVWVAMVSSEPVIDANKIDKSSVEMVVPVITSTNSPFTTHMGISRIPSFPHAPHKNISSALHSFGAQIMKLRYPEKEFMINTPVPIMTGIILTECEKAGILGAVSLGHNEILIDQDLLKESMSKIHPSIQSKRELEQSFRLIQLQAAQQEAIHRGEKIHPIEVEMLNGETYRQISNYNFKLKNTKGETIFQATPEEQRSEFAYLFASHDNFQSSRAYVPTLTIELDALARLKVFDKTQIIHREQINQLGEIELKKPPTLGPKGFVEALQNNDVEKVKDIYFSSNHKDKKYILDALFYNIQHFPNPEIKEGILSKLASQYTQQDIKHEPHFKDWYYKQVHVEELREKIHSGAFYPYHSPESDIPILQDLIKEPEISENKEFINRLYSDNGNIIGKLSFQTIDSANGPEVIMDDTIPTAAVKLCETDTEFQNNIAHSLAIMGSKPNVSHIALFHAITILNNTASRSVADKFLDTIINFPKDLLAANQHYTSGIIEKGLALCDKSQDIFKSVTKDFPNPQESKAALITKLVSLAAKSNIDITRTESFRNLLEVDKLLVKRATLAQSQDIQR